MSLQRIKNVQKPNEIENKIRKQSEFKKFQLLSTKTKFYHLTRHDSFVSFNVIKFGSHVFLITKTNIRMLRFFKFIFQNLKKYVSIKTKENESRKNVKIISTNKKSTIEHNMYENFQIEKMR